MILTQARLIITGISLVASIGIFTWFYFQGKQEAREECLADQAKVMQLWQEKLENAEEQNKELAQHLADTTDKLNIASKASVKRIVKYVESTPDSDTLIFDADGLSILNDAQKGITSESK